MSLRCEDNVHYTAEHRAEEAEKQLDRAHRHYRNVLKALVDLAIKDRVMYGKDDIEVIMERVGENLAHEFDSAISELDEQYPTYTHGASPADSEKLIAEEAERLLDAFRPKPIDSAGLLRDALRPVPTNPATKGFAHE
jgi:hypothetical protein